MHIDFRDYFASGIQCFAARLFGDPKLYTKISDEIEAQNARIAKLDPIINKVGRDHFKNLFLIHILRASVVFDIPFVIFSPSFPGSQIASCFEPNIQNKGYRDIHEFRTGHRT